MINLIVFVILTTLSISLLVHFASKRIQKVKYNKYRSKAYCENLLESGDWNDKELSYVNALYPEIGIEMYKREQFRFHFLQRFIQEDRSLNHDDVRLLRQYNFNDLADKIEKFVSLKTMSLYDLIAEKEAAVEKQEEILRKEEERALKEAEQQMQLIQQILPDTSFEIKRIQISDQEYEFEIVHKVDETILKGLTDEDLMTNTQMIKEDVKLNGKSYQRVWLLDFVEIDGKRHPMSREIAERCLSILLEELSIRNENYNIFKQAEKSVLLSRDFFGWEWILEPAQQVQKPSNNSRLGAVRKKRKEQTKAVS